MTCVQGSDNEARGRSWPYALAFGQVLSWGVLYYSFGIFVTPMRADLDWSVAELTSAMSVAWFVSAAIAIPVGRAIDRFGGQKLIVAGSLCGPILVAAWSQVETLASYYAIWLGIGVVMSLVFYEPAFAVLVDTKRSDAIPLISLVGATAGFIFAPLSSFLITRLGWRSSLLVLATVLAVTTPLHHLFVPKPHRRSSNHRDGRRPRIGQKAPRRRLWLLALGTGAASGASVGLGIHIVPLLIEAGHDRTSAASVLAVMSIALIPGRVLFVWLTRISRTTTLLAAALLLSALAAAFLYAAHFYAAAVTFAVIFGFANSVKTPASAMVLAEWYQVSLYATVSGITSLSVRLFQATAPALMGMARTSSGAYSGAILGLAAVFAASSAAVATAARMDTRD